MKKLEILTSPSKTKTNQGYAIYSDGKKIWESQTEFDTKEGEKTKVDNLLQALGFKLHVIEVANKIIDDNYGIFPDDLEELDKYFEEEAFFEENMEHIIPGDDYEFDQIYYTDIELTDDDSMAYDSNYDLDKFEHDNNINWDDIENFRRDDEDWEN